MKIIFLLLFIFTTLLAHKSGLSYVDIIQKEYTLDITYKKPLPDLLVQDIALHFPPECFLRKRTNEVIANGFITKKFTMECPNSLENHRIWVEGLVRSDKGVMLYYHKGEFSQKALLRFSTPFMQISQKSQSSLKLFFEYVKLGISHILEGYDHLSFVLGVFFLATSFRKLLWGVSAFTLAHSITLAFGILGIVGVAVSFVEAMIALSIIFLARELIVDDKTTLSHNHLGVITFLFGLLHGFGFATSLKDIGLPQNDIPLSLFAFNVGIEVGQLLFIFGVFSVLFFLKKLPFYNHRVVTLLSAYFIGSVSMFWFIQRVSGF